MRIRDHWALGKALAREYLADWFFLCRMAFVVGNIAPDLTATTHLRGHLRDRNTWGHSYANALPVINRLAGVLLRRLDGGLHDCYRLGVLLHYTADAFTWPHNEHFGGTIKEHMRYERRLHREIGRRLARGGIKALSPLAWPDVEGAHARYMARAAGVETDAECILAQTTLLTAAYVRLWSRFDLELFPIELGPSPSRVGSGGI